MKKVLAILLSVLLILCSIAPAFASYDINTAKSSVVRIVVNVTVDDPNAGALLGATGWTYGSGFALGEPGDATIEHIATAAHVTMHWIDSPNYADTYMPFYLPEKVYYHVHVDNMMVIFGDSTSYIQAHLEGYSARSDVAVIRLNQSTNLRQPAMLLDQRTFATGEGMTAMGFPSATEDNLTPEISNEMVSTTERVTTNKGFFSTWDNHASTGEGDQITTTAEMSGGISGGPLVNDEGYVIGVCTSGSVNSQNVNYAAATDELVGLLNTLPGVRFHVGKVEEGGLNTTTIIIIAAAAVAALALLAVILANNGKKNSRTLVFGGVLGGKTVPLKKGSPIVVGRDPNRCQVVYPKDTNGVSSVHCTITYDGKEVTVADNGSSYGTFVGGQKVEPGRPAVMHRGQAVTFGSEKNSADLH